jgi:hypothetical protein
MAKFTLKLEDDYDYDLIGFCSHYNDYRACWAINAALEIQLVKSEELFMVSGKKGEVISAHSFYEWIDEENMLHYYLIKNKSGVDYLIPELSQIDYFLAIREKDGVNVDQLLQKLKNTIGILTAFTYDPAELKSAKNLVF